MKFLVAKVLIFIGSNDFQKEKKASRNPEHSQFKDFLLASSH